MQHLARHSHYLGLDIQHLGTARRLVPGGHHLDTDPAIEGLGIVQRPQGLGGGGVSEHRPRMGIHRHLDGQKCY